MKKAALLLFLVFCGVPSIGSAQQMMIGVRGGVNLASEEWTGQAPTISIQPGILAGGQMDYWFNKSIAASVQLLFDQKGAQGWAVADGPPGYTAIWTGNYIEIPLLVKLSTVDGPFRFYMFGGPSIGFLISNIENFNGNYYNGSSSANITDSTHRVDLSIVFGAGFSLNLSAGLQLFIDAGYAVGLTNTDNYYYDNLEGTSVYSRDIRLATGVLFPLN